MRRRGGVVGVVVQPAVAEGVMAKHQAYGVEWMVTPAGEITIYVQVDGRDGYSVAAWLTRDGFEAKEATPDDPGCAPEVPPDLVTVKVQASRFDAFVACIADARNGDDVMVFPTVPVAFRVINAEIAYEDTPWAKAMGHTKNDA